MKLPLPGPSHLTLWRTRPAGIGVFVSYKGSEGFCIYEALLGSRSNIDAEFEEDGLPKPDWQRDDKEASIALTWPSPPPWTPAEEERQMALFGKAANRFVNSLRPRLLDPSI